MLLAALLLSPLMMEAAIRMAGRKGLVMHSEVGRRLQQASPPLGQQLRPDARIHVTYATRSGEVLRTALMTTNRLRMRGALPRGGSPLIACIGDSHTFGYGVNDHETWPVRLEEELQLTAPDIEVINFGVGGYGPEQELIRLRSDALPYAPDIVLWQWFMNDIDDATDPIRSTDFQRRVLGWTQPYRTDWILELRERSVLVDLSLHAVYRSFRGRLLNRNKSTNAAVESAGWARAQMALLSASSDSTAAGARFAVVVHPLMIAAGEHFASSEFDDVVIEFCEEHGIPIIDLSRSLDPSNAALLRNSAIDYHASAACYAKVARSIAATLREWDWAP